jgi:hypothetical protein
MQAVAVFDQYPTRAPDENFPVDEHLGSGTDFSTAFCLPGKCTDSADLSRCSALTTAVWPTRSHLQRNYENLGETS